MVPKTVNLEDMNKIHNTELRQNKKLQYILYNGRDHYNGISTCGIVNYNQLKTVNNSNMNTNSKFKLRRRIKQKRNRRTKNSKLTNDENEERLKRNNKYVADTGKINTSEHRARSARSAIHNPESCLDAENEEIVTKDKLAQINEQINDISEEKEKREKRKNEQKDDNKNNKKAKIKTEDSITKNILKIHSRIHKRKYNLPPVKKIEGEKRYKYKEKHDDK